MSDVKGCHMLWLIMSCFTLFYGVQSYPEQGRWTFEMSNVSSLCAKKVYYIILYIINFPVIHLPQVNSSYKYSWFDCNAPLVVDHEGNRKVYYYYYYYYLP